MPRGGIRCSSFAPTSTVTMPASTIASCIAMWREHVTDWRVLKLVWSYLRCMVCEGGEYVSVTRGISLGVLSPLMGAVPEATGRPDGTAGSALCPLHGRLGDPGQDAVGVTARCSASEHDSYNLKLEKHPDKTFIGRIDRGFDFLGYRFVAEGLSLAAQTKQRFVERATRLYEQGAAASRIGEYVRHWLTWVRSGCLEHVWDELLVGVMRSSDVLEWLQGTVLVSGFRWVTSQ